MDPWCQLCVNYFHENARDRTPRPATARRGSDDGTSLANTCRLMSPSNSTLKETNILSSHPPPTEGKHAGKNPRSPPPPPPPFFGFFRPYCAAGLRGQARYFGNSGRQQCGTKRSTLRLQETTCSRTFLTLSLTFSLTHYVVAVTATPSFPPTHSRCFCGVLRTVLHPRPQTSTKYGGVTL